MNKKLYISPVESIFINTKEDIPALEYIPPMTKRRYSILTKVTIEIVHRLMEKYDCTNTKQIYTTSTGELSKSIEFTGQYDVEKEISPSLFSTAIINATIALTAINLKLKAGYTVMVCNPDDFEPILQAAYCTLYIENQNQVLVVYADEKNPYDTTELSKTKALGFLVSKEAKPNFKEIEL